MSKLTECSCAGMVMISMISSTSITSIKGVVLMSIITSGSVWLLPRFMAMVWVLVVLGLALAVYCGSVMKPTLLMPARCTA